MLSCFSPGTTPNLMRNVIINCTELVTYDLMKGALVNNQILAGTFRIQQTCLHLPISVGGSKAMGY